jgi:HPt (histidine-containing phosphotransfer) domain-containing protein
MNDLKLDIEPEFINEAIDEISELIDRVEANFLSIEKNPNLQHDKTLYELLMRDIHSIKGALGMISLHAHMEFVHDVETFLIDSFPVHGFPPGIVELMVDFWSKLANSLEHPGLNFSKKLNMKGCFDCVRKNNYQNVCSSHFATEATEIEINQLSPKEEASPKTELEPLSATLFIGNNKNLYSRVLTATGADSTHLECINYVYQHFKQIGDVENIILDTSSIKVCPLFLQLVITRFHKGIKFVYLIEDNVDLFEIFNHMGNKALTMTFIKVGPVSFDEELCQAIASHAKAG